MEPAREEMGTTNMPNEHDAEAADNLRRALSVLRSAVGARTEQGILGGPEFELLGAVAKDETKRAQTLAAVIYDAIGQLVDEGRGAILDAVTASRIRGPEKVPMTMLEVEMEITLDRMFRAVDYCMVDWPIADDEYEPIKPLSLGFGQAKGWLRPTHDKDTGAMVGFLLTDAGRKRFLERK
jgi:hypothetical protein